MKKKQRKHNLWLIIHSLLFNNQISFMETKVTYFWVLLIIGKPMQMHISTHI